MPDFATVTTTVAEGVQLLGPDRHVPFRIVKEGTDVRYLMGGDLDTESFQVIGNELWIGAEFGPFLIAATLDGRVTDVYPTTRHGVALRSPDNPGVAPGTPPGADTWQVANSGRFEGSALAP